MEGVVSLPLRLIYFLRNTQVFIERGPLGPWWGARDESSNSCFCCEIGFRGLVNIWIRLNVLLAYLVFQNNRYIFLKQHRFSWMLPDFPCLSWFLPELPTHFHCHVSPRSINLIPVYEYSLPSTERAKTNRCVLHTGVLTVYFENHMTHTSGPG